MIPLGVSLKPAWVWLVCYGVELHVHVLNQVISKECHIAVLCRVKIGVVMSYPACNSPWGFIEADMGLAGFLWGRTTCVPALINTKVQCHIPGFPCPVLSEDRGTDVLPFM